MAEACQVLAAQRWELTEDFFAVGEAVAPCSGGMFVEFRCRHFSTEPATISFDGGSRIDIAWERVAEGAGARDADRVGRHPPTLCSAALNAFRQYASGECRLGKIGSDV